MDSNKQWALVVDVPGKNNLKTYRLKVPGGWIYKTLQFVDWGSLVDSSVFVPRPNGYRDGSDDPGWKDMEIAPRDGSRILLWINDSGYSVVIGRWNSFMYRWVLDGIDDYYIDDSRIKGWMELPEMYMKKGEKND
jgi:hypothetical protein